MLHLDYRDARPIYTQIIDGLRQQIIAGVLQPGDKLPSVRELAAELLLEAKGFMDAVVNIVGEEVDVVINATEVTDRQIAQIEDIVMRKTGAEAENIVIMAAVQED